MGLMALWGQAILPAAGFRAGVFGDKKLSQRAMKHRFLENRASSYALEAVALLYGDAFHFRRIKPKKIVIPAATRLTPNPATVSTA